MVLSNTKYKANILNLMGNYNLVELFVLFIKLNELQTRCLEQLILILKYFVQNLEYVLHKAKK